jgi:hypothetical protein
VLELIRTGQVKQAAKEIAHRYNVSGIDGLRAVNNVLGGVPADAELHKVPPDAVFVVTRRGADADHTYVLEIYRAPSGSQMRDEYRLVDVDPVTRKRWNSVHSTWEEAAEQARIQFSIEPDEWVQAGTSS